MRIRLSIVAIVIAIGAGMLIAQDSAPLPTTPECNPTTLREQLVTFEELFPTDFDDDPQLARDHLYKLGALYAQLALTCGYEPNEQEISALIQQTLDVATVADILAASAVGADVDAVLAELETIAGDSFNGQLLYNGIEFGVDGTALGCSGCHNGQVAPTTEGTWTRVNDIRLADPALAEYTVTQYLVESILRPNEYTPPEYAQGLMPDNYGTRMDLQQLADLVAFLESQDQLLAD